MLSSPATIGGMRDGRANVGADFDSWFPSPRLETAKSIFYREPPDLESVLMCFT